MAKAESIRWFHYVRHHDVEAFKAHGWKPTKALEGTGHGEWSQLMEHECQSLEAPSTPSK